MAGQIITVFPINYVNINKICSVAIIVDNFVKEEYNKATGIEPRPANP
jgi:hypothetical protein